ncbi:hypothetical protein [Achromobacter phage Motura]|uniref:Uncharacterized protein n=1 Tax=Achromobacter phage Motura TaxID=2591403 RepID=A0A514CSV4_9CAUD|nr:hypothetical protein H1O15_gp221 [Achromobacter phage Motura]QDH83567.1 hypothetical protein [Achromobacter phage Motura]
MTANNEFTVAAVADAPKYVTNKNGHLINADGRPLTQEDKWAIMATLKPEYLREKRKAVAAKMDPQELALIGVRADGSAVNPQGSVSINEYESDWGVRVDEYIKFDFYGDALTYANRYNEFFDNSKSPSWRMWAVANK